MTLAQRLLLAVGALSLATIFALGFGVREAWHRSEEQRFRDQFAQALEPLGRELSDELEGLPLLTEPLCRHDPLVDSALVGLEAGDLEQRRLAISVRVPELAQALRLDELYVVGSSGEILGAHTAGPQAQASKLTTYLEHATQADVRNAAPLAVEYGCVHRSKGNRNTWVGVYAARHLEPLLAKIGAAYNVSLSFESLAPSEERMVEVLDLPELGHRRVSAFRSRVPLLSSLEDLDVTVSLIGVGTLVAALVLSLWLSKSLSLPLVELAREAGAVAHGEPKPVAARGATEIRAFAAAFNRAIADLTALRKRLAATERIAARREIARRVAHEIKNPLAPIRAAVETLRRLHARHDPAFEEYFDEATRTVLEEVQRITHIVSEFTRFARLPAPNPAPLDIVEVLRAVAKLHDANGTPVTFSSAECPPVNADRDQLVQLVTNLIQNAQYAAESNTNEPPRVAVEVRPSAPDKVRIVVSDNGPGLAPEMRARLFEPYATNKPEGTGLGLAIAQRIAIEHGGEIEYADGAPTLPGALRGATFSVELPLSGPTLLQEAPPESSS
ncbi:MAG TPA: ATP-binding protein [Polyangiaceae bacterium]|nr:ATP-binding protein [Polyangiaceae bacterium]